MDMQAITVIGDPDIWKCATTEVNAWRGGCLQAFARAEAAVTETLLCLSSVAGTGACVQLRHTLGQKLEDLAQAIGPGGGFEAEGRAAQAVIERFRAFESLRVQLAHDVARISLERKGAWVVVFRRVSIRNHIAERDATVYSQPDAARIRSELKQASQRLEAALATLRATVAT